MRVLVVGAHPDDETMLAGGLVARLAAEGNEVVFLCVTRGEGGEAGNPPVAPLDQLGAAREEEERCAARALGAVDVVFLGFKDPRTEVGGPLHTWCANYGANAEDRLTNRDDPASIVLDVAPWFEAKAVAAECHRSQHDMIKRNTGVEQIRDVLRRVEAYRRWPLGG